MIQTTFPERGVMAELMAKMLWEIGAVHFSADKPYKLSSGMMSPVYIDCRKLISFPAVRAAHPFGDHGFCRRDGDARCRLREVRLRGRWRDCRHSLRSLSR